jgi:serine/threonine protein kinase/sugar lactone lactonase YvrE
MADLTLGSTIAGCRLEAVAGRGGMGVVYQATQIALQRPVAVKAIAPELAQDKAFRERFQRESQIAASIEHPNVIPVYEAGELEGTLYLIMRWVDGTDLREMISSSGRLEPERAVHLLRPVASALSAAHRRGLVHRDVKPANVLIARGEDEADEHVYLTDFGIARRTSGDMAVTRTGVLVGTIDYTSPERIEGGRGTPASDIYAFGCMLYEALTGHVPFDRPTELMKMYAHMNDPTPSVRSEVPDVPERLAEIAERAMAKRPEDRFASAGELSAALESALDEDRAPDASMPLPTDETVVDAGGAPTTLAPVDGPTELAPVEEPTELAPVDEPTELAPVDEPTELAPVEEPTELAPVEEPTALAPAAPAPTGPTAVERRAPPAPTAPTGPTAPPRQRRSPLLLAIPVGLIVGIVAIIVLSSGGGGGAAAPTASGSPVSIKSIALPSGSDPGPMWGEGPTVLVTTSDGVRRVGTSGATTTFATPGHPTDVAKDPTGKVWVAETSPNAVVVFNANGSRIRQISLGAMSPAILAVSTDAVWVGASGSANIARINAESLTPSTITAPNPVGAMGEAYGRLWVASPDGTLSALDDSGKPTLKGPQLPPNTVAVGHSDGVWFAAASGRLTRVDPRTSPTIAVNGTYAKHANQFHIADPLPDIASFAPKHLIWVGSGSDQTVVHLATAGAQNNRAVTTIQFHAEPGHLAVDSGGLWVSVPSQNKIYQVTST